MANKSKVIKIQQQIIEDSCNDVFAYALDEEGVHCAGCGNRSRDEFLSCTNNETLNQSLVNNISYLGESRTVSADIKKRTGVHRLGYHAVGDCMEALQSFADAQNDFNNRSVDVVWEFFQVVNRQQMLIDELEDRIAELENGFRQ